MIKEQFLVEIRKHFPLFLSLTIIDIILNIISLFYKDSVMVFIYFLYGFAAWICIIIYVILDIYNNLYIGKDVLIHTLPIKTYRLFLIKNCVFFIGMFMFWSSSLINIFFNKHGLYNTAIQFSINPSKSIMFMILSKILGLLAGLSLITSLVALSKHIKSNTSSKIFIGLGYIFITITQMFINLKISGFYDGLVKWIIGINTEIHVLNQYCNFVPIMIWPNKSEFDISQTLSTSSLAVNIALIIITCLISYVIIEHRKNDYLGK